MVLPSADQGTRGKTRRPEFQRVFLRTGLFEYFDQALNRPILWISAPAGAGKTVAVSSYLKSRETPVLWYLIDSRDDDPAHFFLNLGAAVQAFVSAEAPPLPLLTPEFLPGIRAFSREFFEELFRRLPSPAVIVLDSYQETAATSALHEILRVAGELIPVGKNVIAISREEPPPALARLRLQGDVTVVGWERLLLSLAEAEGLARLRRGDSVPAEFVRECHERSRGWAAGLVLLLDSRRAADSAIEDRSPPKSGLVFDYFASEVLDQLPEPNRTVLLQAALLPRITPRLLVAVSGHGEAPEVLAGLHRQGLFVAQREEPVAGYEFHPLFRDFLQARALTQLGSTAIAEVLARAAAALVADGFLEEAVPLYRKLEDWPALTRAIQTLGPVLLAQGRHRTLEGWLQGVPETVLQTSSWLLFFLGSAQLPFAPASARRLLAKAFRRFNGQVHSAGLYQSWCGVMESIVAEADGFSRIGPWVRIFPRIRSRHPVFPTAEIEIRVRSALLALVYSHPQHPDLPAWAESAWRLLEDGAAGPHVLVLAAALTNYCLWRGHLDRVAALNVLVQEWLQRLPALPNIQRMLAVVRATYLGMTGNGEESLCVVQGNLEPGEGRGKQLVTSLLLGHGVLACLMKKNLGEARHYLDRMRASLEGGGLLHRAVYSYAAARFHAVRGDWPQTAESAESTIRYARQAALPALQALGHLVAAHARFRLHSAREAEDHLDFVRRLARETESAVLQCEACFTEAAAHLEEPARSGPALEALQQGFALSRQCGGLVLACLYGPAEMARLCAAALHAGIEVPYVCVVIRRLGLRPPDAVAVPESWPFPIRIYALGRFSLVIDGWPLTLSENTQRKPLELLMAMLALGGRDVPESRLTDMLWPESDGHAAYRALITNLKRLRRLLKYSEAVVLNGGRLSLDPGLAWSDCSCFERWLGSAAADRDENCRKGLALYHGPFLDGVPESWAIDRRERLAAKFRHQVLRHARNLEAACRGDDAVDCYLRALEACPGDPALHEALIRCYRSLGREGEALAAAERLQRSR